MEKKMIGNNTLKNLSNVPSESYSNEHYYCDYIELIALISNEDIVSSSDIYARFLDDGKITSSGSDENDECTDKWESRINSWYEILKYRGSCYLATYPFIIARTTIKLKADLNEKQKKYLFLLLNSNLKYVKDRNILTSDFEEFSLTAFKNYLPSIANIHRFGKSMANNDRYIGSLANKIDLFASDLNYNTKYESHFFSNHNNGDGGLDIVSWVPFENDSNTNNMSIYFGQCATGKDWTKKQDDTKKFENYINFKSNISHVLFIPYDGRNIDSKFNEEASLSLNLLFDRSRIINLLAENNEIVNELTSFKSVVDNAILYEENIV